MRTYSPPSCGSGRRALPLALLVAGLSLASCSSHAKADPPASSPASASTRLPATTTTAPPSGSPAARAAIERLLGEWDAGLTAVVADPKAVVEGRGQRARDQLAAAFTDDSPYVETLDGLLQDSYVDDDHGVRPGPNGTVQHTTLLRFTDTSTPDSASFVFCSYNDGVDFKLSTGEPMPPVVGITQGAGEAHRTADGWRLYRLRQLTAVSKPPATPDPCPGLVAE